MFIHSLMQYKRRNENWNIYMHTTRRLFDELIKTYEFSLKEIWHGSSLHRTIKIQVMDVIIQHILINYTNDIHSTAGAYASAQQSDAVLPEEIVSLITVKWLQ